MSDQSSFVDCKSSYLTTQKLRGWIPRSKIHIFHGSSASLLFAVSKCILDLQSCLFCFSEATPPEDLSCPHLNDFLVIQTFPCQGHKPRSMTRVRNVEVSSSFPASFLLILPRSTLEMYVCPLHEARMISCTIKVCVAMQ